MTPKQSPTVPARVDLYRAIFDHAGHAIVIADDSGKYVEANAAACHLFGVSREQMLSRQLLDFVAPGQARLIDVEWGAFQHEKQLTGEFELMRPDGQRRILRYSAVANFIPGLHLSILNDITQEKSLASEWQSLQDTSPDVIARFDQNLRYLYVNPAIKRITGLPPDFFIGKTNAQAGIPPATADYFNERLRQTFSTGKPSIFDLTYTTPCGPRLFECRLVPEPSTTAALATVLALSRDITEARNSPEAPFRLFVESVKDYAMFMLDPGGIITTWNEGAERLSGYSAHEILGAHVGKFSPAEEVRAGNPARALRQAASTGRHEEEGWRLKKDTTALWAQVLTTALRDQGGSLLGFALMMRDLTEHKRVLESLAEAKAAAEAASKAKSQFLAVMSHEIRTPLNAIMGFCDLLLDPEQSPSERSEYAARVRRNGRLLVRLIDDILDLSKIEAGKLEIEHIEVNLPELLHDVAMVMRHIAEEKAISFSVQAKDPLPTLISTDPTRLKQILTNMIGNALKFTAAGSVTVTVEMDDAAAQLHIVIADTGIGIEPQQAAKLFQPFMQADASTTRRFGGAGLGLALSRRLAQALGGDLVLLNNSVGRGSTFRITIAAPGAHYQQATTAKKMPEESCHQLDGMNILLAEDVVDNQVLFTKILVRAGATVEVVDDGEKAVRQALASWHDLILMDIQMPNVGGLEATARLRAQGYEGMIVALTAHAMREEIEQCQRAGCNAHLAKPADKKKLIDTIYQLVTEQRRTPRHGEHPRLNKEGQGAPADHANSKDC